MENKINFPFTAVCAQDDFRLCMVLCMVDPGIGGVLAMGDKGTGKTTTVRGLAQLMRIVNADFSFINLPIGATEDRVLGSVKLEVLVGEKRAEIHKGLLAAANNGVLYIDEVNLLNDYLMDVLLDAAASGGYYLERDGVSGWQESRFSLVGTMNPEEGELRPQLLDRFGLSVTVTTPSDKAVRTEIIRRRLAFDASPADFVKQYSDAERALAARIKEARSIVQNVVIPADTYEHIAELCIANEVEGLRADILLAKAARAHAAFNERTEVTGDDIDTVLPFVIGHRSKKYSRNQSSRSNSGKEPQREEKEGDTKRLLKI